MRAIRTFVAAIALIAGANMAQAQCAGDCNGSGDVAVNELVLGVNIALDRAALSQCMSFDGNSSGQVEVNELVTGVNNALRGCSATPTPTLGSGDPTPTPTTGGGDGATCTFVSTAGPDQSLLQLCLLGQCPPPYGVSGEFKVTCEAGGGAGGAGSRDCSCEFERFDPVEVPGVGFACVTEPLDDQGNPVVCPAGLQDCGGTLAVNIDSVSEHETGTCSSNADCATKCENYCAALDPPKVRFSSGCESFCQGGDRVDMPCECDSIPAATCNPASTLSCPNSSCEGKDNEADIDCHCQCINQEFGDVGPAGALRCGLPTAIRVESSLPCDGQGVLVRLPPLCAPLTTGMSSTFLNHLNEGASDVAEPGVLEGAEVACSAIDSGNADGMTLVANLTFFDSTVGDIISQLTLKCQ